MKVELGTHPTEEAYKFYQPVLTELAQSKIPFIIGGSFALVYYTHLQRQTKDLDIFIRAEDCDQILGFLSGLGLKVEHTHPHWLAKATNPDGLYLDIIYSSGNGISPVDEEWFNHAPLVRILQNDLLITPLEEMIWVKSYIMERNRYDGADVAHLIYHCSEQIDWDRLIKRFDTHWPLLLSQLILFEFIYPNNKDKVPQRVITDLLEQRNEHNHAEETVKPLCQGTLLSAIEYEPDIMRHHADARLIPFGKMKSYEIQKWKTHIKKEWEKLITL